MTDINIEITLTPKQRECWQAFHNPDINSILFGGAMGGGKSYIGCLLLANYAKWVIKEFNLPVTKYPIQLGFMGRNRAVDFNDTTLETWKRLIPKEYYYIRSQDKEIVIEEKVKYAFGGLDTTEAVSKFSSAEFAVVFIDQAEECDRDNVAVLRSRFRLQINNTPLPYKELYTANPKNCWLKDEFVLGNDTHKIFIPALPKENPYLPKTYIDSLKEAFKHRPELLLANLEGSWDSLEGSDIVIKDIWIRQAELTILPVIDNRKKKVIACDVSRFGDDETVLYYMEGTDIKDAMIFGQKDTMQTAGKIHIWAQEKRPDLIGIDEIGVGAGVTDRLIEMGNNVLPINSSNTGEDKNKYYNLRAQMWWEAGEMFARKDIQLTYQDSELRRQLTAPTYEIRNGRIKIEEKEKIKDRLGRSPDRADTYIMGLYTLKRAVYSELLDRYDVNDYDYVKRHSNKYSGL
uniref:Putative terminase n=1 Tax=viral metagenome TaxID=1070528 RepID=A0A6M3IF81_9ZZZZ